MKDAGRCEPPRKVTNSFEICGRRRVHLRCHVTPNKWLCPRGKRKHRGKNEFTYKEWRQDKCEGGGGLQHERVVRWDRCASRSGILRGRRLHRSE